MKVNVDQVRTYLLLCFAPQTGLDARWVAVNQCAVFDASAV